MKLFLRILAAAILCSGATASLAADAVLSPGDVLKVSVFGNPDLSMEAKIDDEGDITYPLIGKVVLAGLSPPAAEKKIADLLIKGAFLRNPDVHISVPLLQSQQVSVLGQVNKPGRYAIDGKHSVTDIIAMAGGVSPEGGDTATVVRTRDGKTDRQIVDLIDIVRSADMKKNLDLKNGDVVYVERAPKFYIYGEVQHPGGYRLERNMTVLQAISIGGGLSARGTERGIRVKRVDDHGNLQVMDAKHGDLLQANDVVYVKEGWF